MITGVRKIVVPVDDQQKALDFWTDRMGFTVTTDAAYGAERWIEVTPPDQSVALVLSLRAPDEPRRQVPDQLPHSDVHFTCADIARTYDELSGRGVVFPTPPTRMDFGWWAMFSDCDGTRYALGCESISSEASCAA